MIMEGAVRYAWTLCDPIHAPVRTATYWTLTEEDALVRSTKMQATVD